MNKSCRAAVLELNGELKFVTTCLAHRHIQVILDAEHTHANIKNKMTYKQTLGDWGEARAAEMLAAAGFSDIVSLNANAKNHAGGDILAARSGAKFLFSVKARDRFMQNGKVNWGYNIFPQKVIAAAEKYEAEPAWLVIRVDRRDNTYCAYWGLISEIPATNKNINRVYVSMLERAISGYKCLGQNISDSAISQIFLGKPY